MAVGYKSFLVFSLFLFFSLSVSEASPKDTILLQNMDAGMSAIALSQDNVYSAIEGVSRTENWWEDGVATFARVGGNFLKPENNNNLEVYSENAIVALGRKVERGNATIDCAMFGEQGVGHYENRYVDLHSNGTTHYAGGGFLGKWKHESGFYIDGSVKSGTLRDEIRSGNIQNYSIESPYWGAHIGIGKEFLTSDSTTFDLFVRYSFARRDGVNITEDFALQAVTNRVAIIGIKHAKNSGMWRWRVGVEYEHEFDDSTKAVVDGVSIQRGGNKGHNWKGFIGTTMKLHPDSLWVADFDVIGRTGQNNGVGGYISFSMAF